MRRNLADILKSAKIDIEHEYFILYQMIYYGLKYISCDKTFDKLIDQYFYMVPYRGTATSRMHFDRMHDISFNSIEPNIDVDDLLFFCEYWYNLAFFLDDKFEYSSQREYANFVEDSILRLIEKLNYKKIYYENVYVFVEKDKAALAVSEIIDNEPYDVLFYNHYSLKGNLSAKRNLIIKFANLLEPKRLLLKNINNTLENRIFELFNKLNIRHNNVDEGDQKNYIPYVASMGEEELEKWYDEIYQMFLLSILEIEHLSRKKRLEELFEKIR